MPTVKHGRRTATDTVSRSDHHTPRDRQDPRARGRRRPAEPIDDVWRSYSSDRNIGLRERLVDHYMTTHVRRIAERLHSTLPRQVDIDDLVQEGYLGLVDAIDRYDMDRDVRFETFSSRRVYGAMQDYLREIDPIPRVTRARSKYWARIVARFEAEHGRLPNEDEVQAITGEPMDEVRRLMAAAKPASFVPFSTARPDDGDDEGDAMSAFTDRDPADPVSTAERNDLKRWITEGFTRRDRLIIVLYYFEKMTMKEVGQVIGCCESRVSQRLESILQRLRSRFAETGAEIEFGAPTSAR